MVRAPGVSGARWRRSAYVRRPMRQVSAALKRGRASTRGFYNTMTPNSRGASCRLQTSDPVKNFHLLNFSFPCASFNRFRPGGTGHRKLATCFTSASFSHFPAADLPPFGSEQKQNLQPSGASTGRTKGHAIGRDKHASSRCWRSSSRAARARRVSSVPLTAVQRSTQQIELLLVCSGCHSLIARCPPHRALL